MVWRSGEGYLGMVVGIGVVGDGARYGALLCWGCNGGAILIGRRNGL